MYADLFETFSTTMAPLNRSASLPITFPGPPRLTKGFGSLNKESVLGSFFRPRTPPEKTSRLPSLPVGSNNEGGSSSGRRAPSPFFRARRSRDKARARDTSPEVKALKKDQAESDNEGGPSIEPQASAYEDDSDSEEEDEVGLAPLDEETERNTEANAVYTDTARDDLSVLDVYGEETEQDALGIGEGPNVIVPPPALFPSAAPRRKPTKSKGLDLITSHPVFARDRCTINLTYGDPDGALEQSGKRLRRYVVLSDLSDESRYAIEWAIGTVARDGDEVFVISVKEDDDKGEPLVIPVEMPDSL